MFLPLVSSSYIEKSENNNFQINNYKFSKTFSTPIIYIEEDSIKIDFEEANSYISLESHPKLPVYSKVFELPYGSEIIDVKNTISEINNKMLTQKVEPVPFHQSINDITPVEMEFNNYIYNSNNLYPSEWVSYQVGVGINNDNKIVKFISVKINPIRYNPVENNIKFIGSISVEIIYSEP